MSSVDVRAGLEVALQAITPALATAFENVSFTPAAGVAYQRVTVLFAQPDNSEIGRSYLERGYMQVDLAYPQNAGPGPAQARAELLRTTFWRGRTVVANGQQTLIDKTPEIVPGYVDGDRYVVPVKIPFRASV